MGTTDVVLAVLLDGPQHGYEIKRIHDEWFPAGKPLAYGQVYATLSRLEKDECVEVVETRVASGPERTVYALTDSGRQRVERWLSDPLVDGVVAVGELVRKTVAAVRTSSDPRPMLARQRTAFLRQMRDLQQTPAADPLSDLARDHVLAHLDADLRWLDRTLERVAAANLEAAR
jgi:DNA-binding PadR family transcriptional regulator